MRRNTTWGGNIEIQAASLVYNINICIHQLGMFAPILFPNLDNISVLTTTYRTTSMGNFKLWRSQCPNYPPKLPPGTFYDTFASIFYFKLFSLKQNKIDKFNCQGDHYASVRRMDEMKVNGTAPKSIVIGDSTKVRFTELRNDYLQNSNALFIEPWFQE